MCITLRFGPGRSAIRRNPSFSSMLAQRQARRPSALRPRRPERAAGRPRRARAASSFPGPPLRGAVSAAASKRVASPGAILKSTLLNRGAILQSQSDPAIVFAGVAD